MATSSIYSRGGIASIRQWLDALQVPAIDLHLPATSMSEAKKMFHVSDGKLLVRAPLHANLQSSQAKALDRVVSVSGNDGLPEELLRECASNMDKVVKLQRDRKSNNSKTCDRPLLCTGLLVAKAFSTPMIIVRTVRRKIKSRSCCTSPRGWRES